MIVTKTQDLLDDEDGVWGNDIVFENVLQSTRLVRIMGEMFPNGPNDVRPKCNSGKAQSLGGAKSGDIEPPSQPVHRAEVECRDNSFTGDIVDSFINPTCWLLEGRHQR